jgi:hypothetical protein
MATEHFNDPNIPDEERLFRRINLTHVVEGSDGTSLVSSAAFGAPELSVNIEEAMRAAGREPEDSLKGYPNDLLMSITAGVCRMNRQLVGPDPTPQELAHGYVFSKKTQSIKRALRDAAAWIVPRYLPSWDEIRSRKERLESGSSEAGPQ